MKVEKVNHPSHYKKEEQKECIDQIIDDYGRNIGAIFCLTNAYKYLYRAGNKEGSPEKEDIAKARWYFEYVNGRLLSSVTGKHILSLYCYIKKELSKHK